VRYRWRYPKTQRITETAIFFFLYHIKPVNPWYAVFTLVDAAATRWSSWRLTRLAVERVKFVLLWGLNVSLVSMWIRRSRCVWSMWKHDRYCANEYREAMLFFLRNSQVNFRISTWTTFLMKRAELIVHQGSVLYIATLWCVEFIDEQTVAITVTFKKLKNETFGKKWTTKQFN
jgi:hypothetical protein